MNEQFKAKELVTFNAKDKKGSLISEVIILKSIITTSREIQLNQEGGLKITKYLEHQ